MTYHPTTASIRWYWPRNLVLIAGLLVTLALVTPPASGPLATARIQPILLALAAQHPNTSVSVIVQKHAGATGLEQLVAQLGGSVTQDLRIINAFTAELPAPAVVHLARAKGVRWVNLDAPLTTAVCDSCIDTTNLVSAYIKAIRADTVWNKAPYRHGEGIGVAVVDTGIDQYTADLGPRVVSGVRVNASKRATSNNNANSTMIKVSISTSRTDHDGHGTHIAGIIGGDGTASNGAYIGVAPRVNLINVQVTDSRGQASSGNMIYALQWILDNKDVYNIRVVNISLNSAMTESYLTSPINAAVEILWFNRIVVVASAGNNGVSGLHPPANDPFVITVGAVDDRGTADLADDNITAYSAYGTTADGVTKPDLVAPGKNIVSTLSGQSHWAQQHPDRVTPDGAYFRLSGTSMAAPMVTGAAALLLQDEPNLTPDQVKYRLTATANRNWRGFNPTRAGAGYLDVYAALTGTTTQSANTGLQANTLLWTGSSSPNWGSVNWGSVNWGSVNWGSVNWGSDYWGD